MLNSAILNRAIKEALKSTHKMRHGCVIFKNSHIISTGYNGLRHTNRLDPKYLKWKGSLHAEQRAIIYATKPLLRTSILVIRLNQKAELMYSKPCIVCQTLLKEVGITKIYYSTQDGIKKIPD